MSDIAVIGTGYVGLVVAVGLADFGNRVVGVDIDSAKVGTLKRGESPIYEQEITPLLRRNLDAGRLAFTDDVADAVRKAELVFLAVGTPMGSDGSADLFFIERAVDTIADSAKGYTVAVMKSTVPVGTCRSMQQRIAQRNPEADVDVVSNPEFLREGRAFWDFFHPHRTVIGSNTERAQRKLQDVYHTLGLDRFVCCNWETAELIKYATNAFLATKITFINQIANLTEAVGADISQVAETLGMDNRISEKFLHPGPGYGGSCFPKDTRALIRVGSKVDVDMSLVRAVIQANEDQKKKVARDLTEMMGSLKDRTLTVLGLTFKAGTDDVRESPALMVVNDLLAAGARVHAHDPQGMESFQRLVPEALCFPTPYQAVKDADGLVLMTEWHEYRTLDLGRIAAAMRGQVLLDTRNLLDPHLVRAEGFSYRSTGFRED